MPFQLSPGVLVVEKDLTGIVPSVATSIGGFVGTFQWGPVNQITTLSNEAELVKTFGKPNDIVAASWFAAANFLGYSNNLKTVRVVEQEQALNAVATGSAILIENEDDWEANFAAGNNSVGLVAAKYPGLLGNSIGVAFADSSTPWTGGSKWAYAGQFDSQPGTSDYVANLGGEDDEMHIIVIDTTGKWTGQAGSVLEKFAYVSKASDAKKSDGSKNYWREVLRGSKYIWWMDEQTGSNWGTQAEGTSFTSLSSSSLILLQDGEDGNEPSDGEIKLGWDLFNNAELVDVNLLIQGPWSLSVGQYIVELALTRMDCVAFVSPALSSVTNNVGAEADDIVADRNTLGVNSSYGVMDSGWKYQYDKYNDKYRWVALNADIAGLCARTDNIADPWFSPGGLNRGQIKNVVKLAYSPDKTDRDELYKNGINPVVTFPGDGTVLFGDKTLLTKPSAFDRINVRRLFIVLEKSIARAGKYQLFEFNDAFTRAQFRNIVEPFLRDVKGRRGIYDFRVVCDETNNTGEVIDRNEFVADIYIKPARSINFMQLNFIATRTGVSFEEVVGA